MIDSANPEPRNIPVPDPSTLTTAALLREVAHLADLFTEKFKGIDQRFTDNKLALDAALAAAKEAVEKSEIAFAKQIDRILETIAVMDRAHGAQIADLKGRLDRGDGTGAGRGQVWGYVVALIGVLVGIAGVIAAYAR